MKHKLIAIVGTTASGKSTLGIELAKHYGGEVISADSRQIYRYLNLGTGKVTEEEMAEVKHHLIDVKELNEPFSMGEFQPMAYAAIDGVIARGKMPLLVGGTGLYTRSVVEGYNLVDVPPNEPLRRELEGRGAEELRQILSSLGVSGVSPEASERRMIRMIEKCKAGYPAENESNPRYDVLQLGITFPREVLYKRIEERLDARIKAGMVEEVDEVMRLGATPEFLEKLGLEYRATYRYLTGKYSSFKEYRDDLLLQICHFAKRQGTWFKKEKNVIWLDVEGDIFSEAKMLIDKFINEV